MSGPLGDLRDVGDTIGVAGVDQPVAHAGGGQEYSGQLPFRELATASPIVLRLSMLGQAEQRRAVGADGEAELCVEPGVEVGKWVGVGLVEGVLETPPVPRRRPAAVHVLVDQSHTGDVVVQSGHTLQAIRNLSASCSRLRWA